MVLRSKVTGLYFLLFSFSLQFACDSPRHKINNGASFNKGSYGYDLEFLKQLEPGLIELSSADGKGKIIVSPKFQGRVMTSTSAGDSGISFGWLNYQMLSAKEMNKQFNPVGGEERFWMGPEGGQYSIYFKQNDSFQFKNWQVPAFLDTESFDVAEKDNSSILLTKNTQLVNYSGTIFDLNIKRKITLLKKSELEKKLGRTLPSNLNFTAYQTENSITNIGEEDWEKESGLLSVWLLGMFTPTPSTQVIIPFKGVDNPKEFITDNYFGPVPVDRLYFMDSILFFRCDGNHRSKIGIAPSIAKPIAAAFDYGNNILTLVIPELYAEESYVNSKWELQEDPYKGDVINAYNDGPLEDGSIMGPFFEIESSSPALALVKNQTFKYSQVTCHIQADFTTLQMLVKGIIGADLVAPLH